MKTVIVHESMFDNTERFASAIRDAMPDEGVTAVATDVRTAAPADVAGTDLLVVGAPTHAFSLSRPSTREEAVRKGAEGGRAELGIREWLALVDGAFPARAARPAAVAFDIRVGRARFLPGSAAHRATRVLRSHGFRIAAAPCSFLVDDVTGPPSQGELQRAREWTGDLAGLPRGLGSQVRGAS